MPRSSVYQAPKQPTTETLEHEEHIKARLDFWRTKQCCLGTRGLKKKLQKEDGITVGRKLIKRYMEEMGIYAVYPKPNLSKRGKEFKKFPYLLKNKAIFMPNKVRAVDITYIKMGRKHMYLTAIIDCSPRVADFTVASLLAGRSAIRWTPRRFWRLWKQQYSPMASPYSSSAGFEA